MFDNQKDSGSRENEQLPIFLKAEEICKLVDSMLMEVDSKELDTSEVLKGTNPQIVEELFNYSKSQMLSNALLLPIKITEAENGNIYDVRMENASIIRTAGMELVSGADGLQSNGYRDVEYLDLLRDEMDDFRMLFVNWVASFDKSNYVIDRWGLFNPPGVNFDDREKDHL